MAGGTAKTFNRHSITVQGEKLVDRTVRLLKENGQNDIWGYCCSKRNVSSI